MYFTFEFDKLFYPAQPLNREGNILYVALG